MNHNPLAEISDALLRSRCHVARLRAHNAPKALESDGTIRSGGDAWARRSNEYFVLLTELQRRGLSQLPLSD